MIRAPFLALALALVATPAVALEAKQHVLKEVAVERADGSTERRFVPAENVTPGETVAYAIVFRNDRGVAAEGVVLTMPIPAEVLYVEGSAAGAGAVAAYSADGGTTFGAREALRVAGEDGMLRPAAPADLTHVRWTVASIAPGQSGQLSFKGVLK